MEEPTPEQEPQPRFTVKVLQYIKDEQIQNGLKQGELQPDYARYRHHCTNRLRSLYLSLKLTHGKGRYQKRKIEPQNVTDARYMEIPLLCAERAWALAMELKKETEKKVNLQKRRHAIKRLAKACVWASELSRLSADRCDSRTIVEAEAYLAWMQGNLLMERGKDWERAFAKYTRARKLWQALSEVVDLGSQGVCLAAVEQVEPLMRFAEHQVRSGGRQPPAAQQLTELGELEAGARMAELQALLASLAADAAAAAAARPAEATAGSVEWRGRKLVVRNERVRVALQLVSELQAEVEGAMDDDATSSEARLARYDKLAASLAEARAHVTNAIKSCGAEGAEQALVDELLAVDEVVAGMSLEAAIARTRSQLVDVQQRCAGGLEKRAQGKRIKDKEARKYGRAEDCVRLAVQLLRSYQELSDLAARLGGRQGEQLHELCAAQVDAVMACRCYWVAHTYLAADDWVKATACFNAALQRCEEARGRLREALEVAGKDPGAEAWMNSLQELVMQSAVWRCVSAAECESRRMKREEDVAGRVAGLGLSEQPPQQQGAGSKSQRYLLDGAEEWQSYAGDKGRAVRLTPVPPRLQSVAVLPIMLDTAWSYIDYPSLAHRTKKTEKKGWFSSGWFGAAKS